MEQPRNVLVALEIRAAVCVIIGVVLTVGSTWVMAAVSVHVPPTTPMLVDDSLLWQPPRRHWPTGHMVGRYRDGLVQDTRQMTGASFVAPMTYNQHVDRFGWPWRALWYEQSHRWDTDNNRMLDQRISYAFAFDLGGDTYRLPLRPHWRGFMLNAIVWAVLIAVVWWMIPAGRMWRRHQRGRCVHCGYDLRGGVPGDMCPECGIPTAPARST